MTTFWWGWVVAAGLSVVTAPVVSTGSQTITRAPFGIDVTQSPYSAKADGVTDDTDALQRAIDAVSVSGGTVWIPHGLYKTSRALKVRASNVSIVGDGAARILFQPREPFVLAVNDRALILGRDFDGLSDDRPLAGGTVPVGAVAFRAASARHTSDLTPGDWVIVQETDPRVNGEIVWIDWVQVDSVYGAIVRVQSPFRTAFPNNHRPATLRFLKVLQPVENIVVRDLTIEASLTRESVVAVSMAIVRGVLLDRVTSNVANGNAFFSYRSADVTLRDCRQLRTSTQSTEFAATIGLRLIGNTFGVVGTAISHAPPNTSSLALDYGTAFFEIVGNEITTGANILMQLNLGVHDGIVANNIFGWSRDSTIGKGQGINALGVQNVLVSGNVLVGGDGPDNTGISFASSSALAEQIPSQGNVIGPNIIRNFAHPYGAMLAADSYFPVR